MIYLASPFSDPSEDVRLHRTQQAIKASYILMFKRSLPVFSPIVYSASIADHIADLPTDAKSWSEFNRAMFLASSEMYILAIEGWNTSLGVDLEIAWAQEVGMTITMIAPREVGLCE